MSGKCFIWTKTTFFNQNVPPCFTFLHWRGRPHLKKICYKLNFHQLADNLFKNNTSQHDTNVSFHLFWDPRSRLHICQKGREQSRPEWIWQQQQKSHKLTANKYHFASEWTRSRILHQRQNRSCWRTDCTWGGRWQCPQWCYWTARRTLLWTTCAAAGTAAWTNRDGRD